jgi:NAD(P)-dependent dehydrogenase (short-subunit alcohol dehydrogenase family)
MLRNVVAIVSGGASGLGAATASYLVRRGARVIVVDLPNSNDRFLTLKNEIMTTMHNDDIIVGSLEFAPANVTNEDEISLALDKAAELFGEQGRLCFISSILLTRLFFPLLRFNLSVNAYFIRFSQCCNQLRWNCTSEEDPLCKNR